MLAHYRTQVESPVLAGFPPVLFSPLLVETLAVKIHCIRRIGNLVLRSGIICSELHQGSLAQTIVKMVTPRVTSQLEQRFRHDLDHGHRLWCTPIECFYWADENVLIPIVFWSSPGGWTAVSKIWVNGHSCNFTTEDLNWSTSFHSSRTSKLLSTIMSEKVYYLAYSSHSTGYSISSFCDRYSLIFPQTSSRYSQSSATSNLTCTAPAFSRGIFPTLPPHAQFHPRQGLPPILYLGVDASVDNISFEVS